jgi:hypothetical protein
MLTHNALVIKLLMIAYKMNNPKLGLYNALIGLIHG